LNSMLRSAFFIILWFLHSAYTLNKLNRYVPNILTVCLNKYIFQYLGFTFPLTLTAIHMLFSGLGAAIVLHLIGNPPLIKLDASHVLQRVFPLSFLFCFNIVLGNISIRWVPVSFMQTVKSSVPAFALLLQYTLFRQPNQPAPGVPTCLSMIPIVGGVSLATGTEVNFEMTGFLAALAASMTTAMQAIITGRVLEKKMDSVNLVYYMAPFSFILLAPLAYHMEYDSIVNDWSQQDIVDVPHAVAVLVFSGIVAFCLNVTSFLVIANTSPLTFTVCGNFKVILSTTISVMIFQNEITYLSGLGCAVAIGGMIWYNKIRYEANQKAAMASKKAQSDEQKV